MFQVYQITQERKGGIPIQTEVTITPPGGEELNAQGHSTSFVFQIPPESCNTPVWLSSHAT